MVTTLDTAFFLRLARAVEEVRRFLVPGEDGRRPDEPLVVLATMKRDEFSGVRIGRT